MEADSARGTPVILYRQGVLIAYIALPECEGNETESNQAFMSLWR